MLEGLPGAGKSTIGNLLARHGWACYGEVATDAALAGVKVAASNSQSLDTLILCGEVIREERIRSSSHTFILAESSHLSNLAWSKTRAEFFRTNGYGSYLAYYKFATATGRILYPTAYVRLVVSPELSLKRYPRQGRVKVPSAKFLSRVASNLDLVHRRFEPDVPLSKIDSSKSLQRVAAEVREVLSNISSKNT